MNKTFTDNLSKRDKYCGSCGKELLNNDPFCPNCGQKIIPDPNHNKSPKKSLIITFTSIILVLLIIIGVMSMMLIPKTSENTKTDSNNPLENLKTYTAQEYVDEVLLKEYKLVEDSLKLQYKFIDGVALMDCSNFSGALLGYRIEDFNHDGDDDIFVIKVRKNETEKREDGYSKIIGESNIFLANDFGNFNLSYTSDLPLYMDYGKYNDTTLSDHFKETHCHALHQTSDSNWYLLKTSFQEDDRDIYKDNEPYYSIENSLGSFRANFDVYEIGNNGALETLSIKRDVSHMSCMPEAEYFSYYMGTGGASSDLLFSGGVNSITTGTGIDTPILNSQTSGPCSSENSACKKINKELDKYELQNYHFSTFKWSERFDNFLLEDSSMQPINFVTSTKTSDKESGEFIIKVK